MKNSIFFAVLFMAVSIITACENEKAGVLALKLDNTSIELVKGETFQLNATLIPENENAEIRWFSEDESYVTVDQTGLVTAVALKKEADDAESDEDDENSEAVSVFAQYEGGAAECLVTVLPLAPSKISLLPSQHTMKYGEQVLLTVKYEPENVDIKEVEWSTTAAAVATVKDGVVKAKGYGSCEIIARYGRIEARTYILVLK